MTIKRALLIPMLFAALTFYFGSTTQPHMMLHAAGPSFISVAPMPEGSPANNTMKTVDGNGNTIKCEDIPEAKGGVLLGRIVPCLIRTIGSSTQKFSAKMIMAFAPLFYSYLVFVVTMFGVKILQGGRGLHQEAIVLLLKITLVIGILNMIPNVLVPSVYGIMTEAQSIVTNTIGPDNSSINCDISHYRDGNTPLVWAQMDCVLGKLYGFTTGSATLSDTGAPSHNMFLAASMIGLMGGFFFSGTLGITIFFACIGVLVSVFIMVMRTAISFVNGYLMVCVMLIIAPFFLPLVFMRVTSGYFEKWWQSILGSMLLPILVTAYAMFALLLYDKMLFSKDALVNQLFNYDLIKKSQNPPSPICGKQHLGMTDFTGLLAGGSLKAKVMNPYVCDEAHKEMCASVNNPCAMFPVNAVDSQTAAQNAAKTESSKAGEIKSDIDFIKFIFNDCLKLVILAFLITKGMEAIMAQITLMTGTQTSSALVNATSKQEEALKQKWEKAQDGAREAMYVKNEKTNTMEDAKGAAFLGRLGPATMNMVKRGFLDKD